MSVEIDKRRYRKRRRAELEQETRLRITEATMELHEAVGPAQTTVSAIADRAGVQRATVYRHFPDEDALIDACSSHWLSLHPAPDPTAWSAIADPDERLRVALGEIYGWYESTDEMVEKLFRDAPRVPGVAARLEARRQGLDAIAEMLLAGRRARGDRRRRVRAAIGHALAFETWRSLVREQELRNGQAVELMATMVAAA